MCILCNERRDREQYPGDYPEEYPFVGLFWLGYVIFIIAAVYTIFT